ncbi:hypothetical protein A7X67_18015 [Clostridium sp. W14A]|nr:hypothetical protein A7X67_18015 [Clostridium sp. W14A]
MKKSKKSDLFYWFFAILPFLISAAFYSRVPDQIAVHWNGEGTADGYAFKAFGLFALPAIILAAAVLVKIMLNIDPRSQNIDRSPQMRGISLWFIVILANAMDIFVILSALDVRFNMNMIVTALVGIGIAVIGNYLPKCKFNYTMGIRVPWTLASESNWEKTHRMAGPIWVAGGVLIAPMIYSYAIFRRGN